MAANVTDIRNLIDLDLFDQSKQTVENFQTQQLLGFLLIFQ